MWWFRGGSRIFFWGGGGWPNAKNGGWIIIAITSHPFIICCALWRMIPHIRKSKILVMDQICAWSWSLLKLDCYCKVIQKSNGGQPANFSPHHYWHFLQRIFDDISRKNKWIFVLTLSMAREPIVLLVPRFSWSARSGVEVVLFRASVNALLLAWCICGFLYGSDRWDLWRILVDFCIYSS